LEFELKMIVAYLLTYYNIEFPKAYEGTRPETKWVFEAMMPPSWAKIRIRRRVA
jgi:hypothetical protein